MNAIIESLNGWGARFAGFALPMLLQSTALIILLFALDLVLRKKVRATIRYAVWMLALLKLALPPSLASPTGAAYWLSAAAVAKYSTPVPASATAAANIFVNTISPTAGKMATPAPLTLSGPGAFFVVWLMVALGIGILTVWRLRTVIGVIRQSTAAPEAVRALLESCRRQLGVRRAIPVRCAAIGSPAICGILQPVILLPPALAEKLGKAEMRPVLLHELAHYKRGDLWVNHAQIFLQIVYWYNPLLWLANAAIRRAREQAVDEMVLVEMGGEAQAYPATLLHVAKLGLGRPLAAIGLMGILEPGRGLTQRILHIMNRPLPRTARIGARGLAAVLLLALVALPMACRRKVESAPQPPPSASAQAKAAPDSPGNGEILPMVAFDAVPLPDVIRELGRQAGLKIQIDKRLLNAVPPLITEKWKNVTARQALTALLDNWGWVLVMDDRTKAVIVTDKAALITEIDHPHQETASLTNEGGNYEVLEVIDFRVTPLPDAIRTLALKANLNIQFDPQFLSATSPLITENWKNLTAKQALIVLLDKYGWELDLKPGSKIARVTKNHTALKLQDIDAASDWSGKQPPKYRGKTLTAGEVAALEEKLANNPEDFSARWDLLFYYYQNGSRERRQKHVLWAIEHHPEYSAGGLAPYLSFVPSQDGAGYDQGKALWLKNVQGNPRNATILGNAAAYLLLFDEDLAEGLLKKAQALEPRNRAFSEQLGQLYKLEAMTNPGGNSATKALAEFEKELTSRTTPAFENLDDLATTAFDAGDFKKARKYATELLKVAKTRQDHWNYGNAIQHGNIVLGRIALRDGNVNEAKRYLLAAGKTPGSPQLNSFGPNMSLASDLLAKGENGVVLEYFKQCGKFWKLSRGRLDTWAALVKEGQAPDFGANLEY